ncbi:MAG: glycosyltransferase family 39 protein, partial [Candidatus Eremiobacteraeota bacterium]|nr:glycosyltransferase family 39 protein [Candidatus Eremiobacteraeota bacterium]
MRYPSASRPEPSHRLALGFAAAAFALHVAFANRYDVFRDELYFIVCGGHPAFGYVDQPPVVPLLAAAMYGLAHQTWLLRLPVVLAAAALVLLTCAFVRVLGGGRGATVMAGAATAFAPMFLGIAATLNTTSFEPLCWTLATYLVARRIVLDDRSAMLWCGVVVGITLEIKDSIPFWLVALAVG